MMENMENNNVEQVVSTPAPAVHPKKGMAIASMVLGIVSVVLFCIWYVSIPCAIIAIVLGFLAKKAGKIGMATAGIVTGIIALGLDILAITLLASFIASIGAAGLGQ
jgi:hypothetical protein